ncbi:MAG: hypothetical protein NZ480_07940, partial [Bdellovibrionaceae bacterium]|nr:hypothetical protein [Pseudobdellovibrionaceae bacterium]MDW8189554.1 hypothetical protein [Pseudobdellovibrionaceae bacterium]
MMFLFVARFVWVTFFLLFTACTVKLSSPKPSDSVYTDNQRKMLFLERKVRRDILKDVEKDLGQFDEKRLSPAEWIQFQLLKGMWGIKQKKWVEACSDLERVGPHKEVLNPESVYHYYLFLAMCREGQGDVTRALAVIKEGLNRGTLIDVHRLVLLGRVVAYSYYLGLAEEVTAKHIQEFQFALDEVSSRLDEDVTYLNEFLLEASAFPFEWFGGMDFYQLVKVMMWVQNPRAKILSAEGESPWAQRAFLRSKKEYQLLLRMALSIAETGPANHTSREAQLALRDEKRKRLTTILEALHNYELEFPVPFPNTGKAYQFKLSEFMEDMKAVVNKEIAKVMGTYIPERKG